jgi:hypothetical protein
VRREGKGLGTGCEGVKFLEGVREKLADIMEGGRQGAVSLGHRLVRVGGSAKFQAKKRKHEQSKDFFHKGAPH